MTNTNAAPIRAVLFQDDGVWVGQCLEYDIGAQADTLDELRIRLRLVIDLERDESARQNGMLFAGIGPAPSHFFDKWEAAPLVPKDPDPSSIDMAVCA